MERLTSPNINVDPDTDRFLHATIGGKEIDWKQSRDSTLDVLINGPTSNGFGKDIFRKMARDLYGRLKAYEDTGLTTEEIKAPFTEDTMINLAAQALGVEPSRLRELAEADKDGRVIVLPCKVGDVMYKLFREYTECTSYQVRKDNYCCEGCMVPCDSREVKVIRAIQPNSLPEVVRYIEDIGKTVFFTRAEAERALKEME